MLDTIHLRLDSQNNGFLNASCGLSNVREHIGHETGEISYTGYLKNMRATITPRSIHLKGSLAKSYLGDNCQTLTRKGCERAIGEFSDILGEDFSQASISRVDVAANMVMDYPPQAYYSTLGHCSRLTRFEQPNSIYYQNGVTQLAFYDKIDECKTIDIPTVWSGQNVMRYEMRMKKNLKQKLELNQVLAKDLYSEQTYMGLVDLWYNNYQAIDKINKPMFEEIVLNSEKLIFDQFALMGVMALGGEKEVLELLDQANKEGRFESRQKYYRAKGKLKKIMASPDLTSTDCLTKELNKKIEIAANSYR